jgi:hypothetical protein
MLTVKELREFLDTVSDDAVVAVNGEIVTAPMLASGRMNTENTLGNPAFHRADKGRDQAVMFLHHRQLTTGEWVLDPI